MLWFWWNLIFICKIGQENRFCQYFCTYFTIFRENHDFLLKNMIFTYLDMFTQFEFEIRIFELKQIQIVFWNPENISNKTTALDFQNYPWFFTMTGNVSSKHWKALIFRNLPHFSVYYWIYAKNKDTNQKSKAVVL